MGTLRTTLTRRNRDATETLHDNYRKVVTRLDGAPGVEGLGTTRHVFFVLSALALLIGSIDSTIVVVAVPNLTSALHAPLTAVGWTLTAYLLVQIVMLPVAGKLSDTLGRKRVFLFSLAIFTLGSVLCGLAPSVGWLIAFRALQAAGGGGLIPCAFGIVADQYRTSRAQAIGLFTSVGPIGAIVGPNLGGYILEHWTWRELFFVNVPIGLVVLAGVGFLLRDKPATNRRLDVDPRGIGLYALAIGLLMVGISLAGDNPTAGLSPLVWAMLGVSILFGALFVRHIRRAQNPVMDPQLLLKSPFVTANLYSFVFGAATFGFFSFIPYYAVTRYGMTAFESAAVLTPRALAMVATSALASMLITRTGYRRPMLTGIGLVILTLLLLSQGWTSIGPAGFAVGGFWQMALIIVVGGIGVGLAGPAANNATLDLAPQKAAALTGIRTMFSLTGGALSVAGIVLVLSITADPARGLEAIFQVLAGLLLVALVLALRIPDRAQRAVGSVPEGRIVRIVSHRGPASRLALEPSGLVAMHRQAA